jgi:hypothetical protein
MALGSAPQRNIADGASGGATLMSHHFGGSHAEVIPQSEAIEAHWPCKSWSRDKDGTSVRTASSRERANKQTKLLDLLRRPAGATIAALSNASGWQQHSVRGFLAGVVRKKLGLELVSAVEADQRTYRVIAVKQA